MNRLNQKTLLCLLSGLLLLPIHLLMAAPTTLGDTIYASKITNAPIIDGMANDLCWDSAAWNPMPYVWIPYAATMSPSDFTGRFKAVWNEEEDFMYFLFEITDDKFVNGYVFSESNGNYYLYDVVEIFIDENRSGGVHETNNNAFAYHITGGNTNTDYDAVDMWNTSRKNYKDHFPEFKRVKNGNVYTWEFSMMVLKEPYAPGSMLEDFKSPLETGKKMGFTAAYCDNDNSATNPVRDNFIASKYLTQTYSNDSYKNADHFGLLQLVNEPTNPNLAAESALSGEVGISAFPNPVSGMTTVSFSNKAIGRVDISVFNSAGQLIEKITTRKSQTRFEQQIDFSDVKPGIYYIKIDSENQQMSLKVVR